MTIRTPQIGNDRERELLRRLVAEQVAAAPPSVPWHEVSDSASAVPGRQLQRRDLQAGTRGSRWLATAAASVLVVVGLLAVSQLRSETSPATPPPTPTTELPVPAGSSVVRPTLYPALPASDARNDVVSAGYGSITDNAAAQALVAQPTPDGFTRGVWLGVLIDYSATMFATADSEIVTVDGVDYDLFRENGSPVPTTVVRPGSPALAVSGVDALDFLEAAGGIPIVDPVTDSESGVAFDIGDLPTGYQVVVDPVAQPRESTTAQINLTSDSQEGPFANVQVGSPLPRMATVGTFQRVDVNGVTAWINDQPAYSVVWPIDDTTWARAVSLGSEADALAWARSLEFIDESSWTERYGVVDPTDRMTESSATVETTVEQPPSTNTEEPDLTNVATIDAAVIGRAPDGSSRIEIDRGRADDIRLGMPVINAAGLVGKISSVFDTTSVVMLATSPDFQVATELVSHDDPSQVLAGVVEGQGAGLPLRFSSPAQEWLTPAALGDHAVTADRTSSPVPVGIPIGVAIAVTHPTPDGSGDLRVDIQSNADLDGITSVQVLLYQPASE